MQDYIVECSVEQTGTPPVGMEITLHCCNCQEYNLMFSRSLVYIFDYTPFFGIESKLLFTIRYFYIKLKPLYF